MEEEQPDWLFAEQDQPRPSSLAGATAIHLMSFPELAEAQESSSETGSFLALW